MKKHAFVYVTGLFVILNLMMLALTPFPASAAVVWSENFDNLNEWTMEPVTAGKGGAMSIIDGRLKATGVNWSETSRPSTVSVGTWSFDIRPNTTSTAYQIGHHPNIPPGFSWQRVTAVWFLMEESQSWNGTSFSIWFWANRIGLERDYMSPGGMIYDEFASWSSRNMSQGTQEIDITLDATGNFDVFVNGTHRISDSTIVADLDWSYFAFGSEAPGSIDNIVVQDVVDTSLPFNATDTTTTTTTTTTDTTTAPPPPPIPIEWLALGIGVPVVIIIVIVGLRMRRS